MAEARLADCTDQAKILVRASPGGALAAALGVPIGRAARDGDGVLVLRTAPDAWLLLAAVGMAAPVLRRLEALGDGEFANAFDVTHGYALVRLTGPGAAPTLARVCAIDLTDAATPDRTAFRSLVAGVVATVVRDDTGPGGERSYLVQCDRSYGRYLVDVLTDAASY